MARYDTEACSAQSKQDNGDNGSLFGQRGLSRLIDIIMIRESPYVKGDYYRVDFLIGSIRRLDLLVRLYAFGGVSQDDQEAIGLEIGHSGFLRLLNFLGYLVSFRAFPYLGYFALLWQALSDERPRVVIFSSHWTGLFLAIWRQITGSRAKLVWDWYDLSTRMGYFERPLGILGRVLLRLEEHIAPRHCDGIIVPTAFARRFVNRLAHKPRVHVLGEIRELNPFVSQGTLKRRMAEVEDGSPFKIAWIGVIRHYQREGLKRFLRALRSARKPVMKLLVQIVGPTEVSSGELMALSRELPSQMKVQWHGPLDPQAVDQLLADSHVGLHPLPDELFCRFIYSRKLADYLAASLPVAFSRTEGLEEVAERFGTSFDLGDSQSVVESLRSLFALAHYDHYLSQAWKVSHDEYSSKQLERKASRLTQFLMEVEGRGGSLIPVDARVSLDHGE